MSKSLPSVAENHPSEILDAESVLVSISYHQIQNKMSSNTTVPYPLGQSVGYGVVVGLGVAFAIGSCFADHNFEIG